VARVKPFRAVRYDERKAGPLGSLLALPYDVIGPDERERYLESSPYNVVRLILPDSCAEAARLFAEWRRNGVLTEEDTEAVWWLRQDYEGPDGIRRTRQGVVVSLGLEPYSSGIVRPHERTHAGPKETQLELLRATRASLSPIMLLYDDPSAGARTALEGLAQGEPLLAAQDGPSTNRLWRITDPDALAAARDALADQRLVIADGHHRYETALAFHEEQGTEGTGWTMAVLVNTHGEGLTIFPTHRVVGRAPELDNGFRVTPVAGGAQAALAALDGVDHEHPAFVVYRGDGDAALVEAPGERALDTAALDRLELEEVTYTPRAEEAVALVDSGRAEAAFLLRPPTIEQVEAVAEAGETMPQKSTYFYPKLFSGLLFHPVGPTTGVPSRPAEPASGDA
jgi:uncharacterized protein (DUF1015 family)